MDFILATSNQHKALEFAELFSNSGLSIKAASEKLDVDETGTSYFENAFLKAEAYFRKFKVPVVSDDSGLNVEALPNELGIYSARFGGEGLSDFDRAQLLLKKLGEVEDEKRKAFFTCVLCFYFSPEEVFYFEGRMEGRISHSYRGTTGFGYDPVFIPSDYPNNEFELTVAELEDWKNENSHRSQAVKFALKFFREKLLPK
jgi:XTP/dITP diphosphohydrolase